MTRYDELAMVVGGRDRRTPADRLADRIRLVLETQPGDLPYAPKLGCDLRGLVGRTASKQRVAEARMRITGALEKWLPTVRLASVEVELIESTHASGDPSVPLAEAALASEAVSAVLEIRIEVTSPDGPLYFQALMQP